MTLGLILDTATESGLVVVVNNHAPVFSCKLPQGLQNSKYLLDSIDKGFKELGFKPQQLEYVATGIGPGSYTGIRVAVVVAKTLAFANEIPLIAIPTLWGFISEEEGPFVSVIDAKIGGLYIAIGQRDSQGRISHEAPLLCSYQEFGELARHIKKVITPHPALKIKINASIPDGQWDWIESFLSPERMVQIADERLVNGQFTTDGHIEISYLRKTQAEIEKEG